MWSPNGTAGWLLILLSVGFFKIMSILGARLLTVPPGVYRGYGDEYRVFRWRNLVVSFTHAAITGCWSLTCIVLYGNKMLADMVLYVNWPMYTLCSFATGYFMYDTLDIIIARRIIEKWEIMLHHVAVLIISAYVITYAHCVGYQTVGMLIEVNTVFLHRRQLFQLADRPALADRLVRATVYANLFTFVAFRIFPLAYLTYGLFYDGHRLSFCFRRFYGTCILLINVINGVLFYRLLRADIWPAEGTRKREEDRKREIEDSTETLLALKEKLASRLNTNGLRLRNSVDHIMQHVVQRNVHS